MQQYKKLKELISFDNGFESSKLHYLNSICPKIPYVSAYLHDVSLIYAVNKRWNTDQVNYRMIIQLGRLLHQLDKQQKEADFRSAHNFVYSASLNKLFTDWTPNVSEEELHDLKKQLSKETEIGADLPKVTKNATMDSSVLMEAYAAIKEHKEGEESTKKNPLSRQRANSFAGSMRRRASRSTSSRFLQSMMGAES